MSGCTWSAWSEWSECTKSCGGGNIKRIREKLPGLGPCDRMGDKEDIMNCVNQVSLVIRYVPNVKKEIISANICNVSCLNNAFSFYISRALLKMT